MKAAVFDLDGTLADTLHDLADAVNYGLEQLGCPVHPYDSYRFFVGNGVQKLCERALPDERKADADKLLKLFTERYNAHFLDKTELYSGIRELLDTLVKNGVYLAVATNKPQDTARRIIAELLPDVPFVCVLGGCSEREKKPSPDIIFEITALLPDGCEVFMIGDSSVDIRTAQNAGITSIGCTWGFRPLKELTEAGADLIASSPADIAGFF